MYGLLNVDGCIWLGEGGSQWGGGGGAVGRGDHERSRQEKGAQGGWVAEKTDSFWALLLLRVSII